MFLNPHELTLCNLKWLLAKGPVSLFPCPPPGLILKRQESRFPGSLVPIQGWSRSLSKGRAKLWFRRTSQVKRMFLVIANSHLISMPLEFPPTTFLSLGPKTICCCLCSAPYHPSPQPTSQCSPALSIPIPTPSLNLHLSTLWKRSCIKAEGTGHLSTYPWSSDVFRSALSGVPEPGIAVQPPYKTLLPQHAKSRLGQLRASRLLGGWADEHSKRGRVL